MRKDRVRKVELTELPPKNPEEFVLYHMNWQLLIYLGSNMVSENCQI
jgi:hypothetical protein